MPTPETPKFLLLGAGDLAREVVALLRSVFADTAEIAAFSDAPAAGFKQWCGSADQALRSFPPAQWQALGCIGNPRIRAAKYHEFSALGYSFARVVHPAATVFTHEVSPGCIVFPGARLAIGVRLAEDVVVNFNATVGHDTTIGPHSVIAPGVQLGGRISAGSGVIFGIGASVLQGRSVGDGAVISAGASVWTNVPAGATMMGVPASARKVPGRS